MTRHRKNRDEEETSYWLSYSDMMAALLLTFVLIIAFTMLQSKKQYEEKEKELQAQQELVNGQESELVRQQAIVEAQQSTLEEQGNELTAQQEQLNTLMAQNAEKEQELIEQQAKLKEQQELASQQQKKLEEQQELASQRQKKLEEQQELASQQQKKLEEQESELLRQQGQLDELVKQNEYKESELQEQQFIVDSQQKVMETQQKKLDALVGIRSELIEALKKEFDDTDLGVRIDSQTGAIAFDSSILFDFNDAQLKPQGTEFLTEFFPRYMSILLSEEFRDFISEIIIEGHTDTSGGYLLNLGLSQRRALSVATFCLEDNNNVLGIDTEELRKIITANGRSYSDPIYDENGDVNMAASRRVEFKFRLKDEDMITEMISILSGETMTESE